MDKFEHKIKKGILRSKSIFIYLRLDKYDRKSDFLNKFSLPYSSFNLMKKKTEQSMDIDSRDSDIHHYSNKIENVILETFRSYVQPPTYPLTINKIKQFIFEKLRISINKRKIKAYLKDSLNYSYKKDLQDR